MQYVGALEKVRAIMNVCPALSHPERRLVTVA
jgi:hypothetical protein